MMQGKSGLAYVGVNALQPPDVTYSDRAPTTNDYIGTTGYGNVTFTGDSLYWQIDPSNTYIVFQKSSNASAPTNTMSDTEFENNSGIRFSGFYFV